MTRRRSRLAGPDTKARRLNQVAAALNRSHTLTMTALAPFRTAILRALVIAVGVPVLASGRLEAAASEQTQKIASAAAAFLDTLDNTKRATVSFARIDAAQRIRWSNLPVSMAERRGLRMGDLKQSQRDAVMKLLSTTLS